jgi:CHAT domain-containing protein
MPRLIALFLLFFLAAIAPSWAMDEQERSHINAVEQTQTVYGQGAPEHLRALASLIVYYDHAGRARDALEPARRYIRLLESKTDAHSIDALNKLQQDLIQRLIQLGELDEAEREKQRLFARLNSGGGEASESSAEMKLRIAWQQLVRVPVPMPQGASETERALVNAVNDAALQFGPFGRERLQSLGAYVSFLEETHAEPSRILPVAHRWLEINGLLDSGAPDDYGIIGSMADLHVQVAEYAAALLLYRRHVDYLEAVQGDEAEATLRGHHNIAFVLDRLGRHGEAQPIYEQAAERAIFAFGAENALVAVIKASWAESLAQSGQTDRAVVVARESLAIIRSVPQSRREDLVRCLTSARLVFAAAGMNGEALSVSRELMALPRGADNVEDGAQLHDLAVTLMNAERYKEALDAAERSLALLSQQLGESDPIIAKPLNTLAMIYVSLGKPDQALPYILRSVALTEAEYGPANIEVAKKRVNEVNVLSALKRYPEAIEVMERIAPVIETQAPQDVSTLATYYHNYAVLEVSYALQLQGQLTEGQRGSFATALTLGHLLSNAMDHAERALALRGVAHSESNPARQQSEALLTTLRMLSGSDSPKDATAPLIRLLAVRSGNDTDTTTENFLQMSLVLAYVAQGNANAAILWGKQAVNSLRDKLGLNADLPEELRRSLVEKGRFTFEVLAALLVRQGRIPEAQQVFRMLKEHELGEVVRGAQDVGKERAELTGLEQAQFREFYQLRDQLGGMAVERLQLEQRQSLSETEKKRLADIVSAQQVQVDAIVALLKRIETDMANARVGQNNASATVEASQLQRVIDHLATAEPQAHVVGLQYLVSDDTLTILLTVPNAPAIAHQIKIERVALYRQINRVLAQLSAPDADPRYYSPTLKALYDLLITPVVADLEQLGAKTLMLSLDDQLRLLPFAALMGPEGKYLIQDYTLALYNEAAGQTLNVRGAAQWRVAAMGLSQEVEGKKPLRAVPDELAGIVASPGISGQVFLNERFTRVQFQSVLQQRQSGFNVLHVASHFDFRPGRPQDSVLYMGNGERISLTDLAKPVFDFSHFDLVTYSACQTAIADERNSSAQELEGLSAITQRHGAQAVLASLWSVADQSTGRLMQRYYTARQHLNKAAALRKAQLEMIENETEAAPYRWAPFVLMGNWR